MFLTGLFLAILFLLVVQISQSVRTQFSDTKDDAVNSTLTDLQTVKPILIDSVSESENVLSIRGRGHEDIAISIQNFGEKLAATRSDENGNWAVDIPVSQNDTLLLKLLELIDDEIPVLADETIFRIPPPALDEASVDQSPLALILVGAPGTPTSIFQTPFRGLPTTGGISMGAIDYDESGGVIFSGTSERTGRIRLFANNTAIGERPVDSTGRWYYIAADTLPVGEVTIGAAYITEAGIQSPVLVPFERLSKSDGDISKPLEVFYYPYSWQIRRSLIGGGHQYTAIFAPQEADAIIQQ